MYKNTKPKKEKSCKIKYLKKMENPSTGAGICKAKKKEILKN